MENFAQVPLAINTFSVADSSHENHLLENMGEIQHAFRCPNPFDQAGGSSTNMDVISHAMPFPNHSDQAGVSSNDSENPINGIVQLEESCPFFPLDKILRATKDFDDALVVGTGGFGKVYKGFIDDGATTTVVAIKRLNAESKQGAEEFWTEIKVLSKLRHTHLVSLIGYCNELSEMILVYEYVASGTLANHLYKRSREESGKTIPHLTWEQRLKICLGAAPGLDYLHNGTEQGIIHRDVKSTNILLDEDLVAKVSDFGLSKSITIHTKTHVTTKVKGTVGYLDPDYFYTNRLTKKSDVYAFGVVLLEVLCGRPPVDATLEEEQISLILWAKMHIKKGKLDQITDPSLNGETTPRSLKYFAKLADKCLHNQTKERPTMAEVVESLEIALVSHECNGRLQKTIKKAFQGIRLVPKGMNHWWREGKGNSSKHSFPEQVFDYLNQSVHPRFSLAEIRAATNDFDEGLLIEKDSWFRLYMGWMVGGTLLVAIKRFHLTKLVSAEIGALSLPRHPNILSLIGFCNEEQELILVYDYMVNGTLESHLCESDNNPLLWKKRLEICIDIARGVKYLHTNIEQQVIHHNITPSNVFLDDKWVAKVGNFEFSLPIPTDIAITGLFNIYKATKKSDVYAFGVLMLQVLCAKGPSTPELYTGPFHLWFSRCLKRGTIDEVIDPYLLGKIAPECFRLYVDVALCCLVRESIRRPSIDDVLESLQSSLQLQEAWESSIEMGDELPMTNVPGSYNYVIPLDSEFTIGEQSFLISDLVQPWAIISPSLEKIISVLRAMHRLMLRLGRLSYHII